MLGKTSSPSPKCKTISPSKLGKIASNSHQFWPESHKNQQFGKEMQHIISRSMYLYCSMCILFMSTFVCPIRGCLLDAVLDDTHSFPPSISNPFGWISFFRANDPPFEIIFLPLSALCTLRVAHYFIVFTKGFPLVGILKAIQINGRNLRVILMVFVLKVNKLWKGVSSL